MNKIEKNIHISNSYLVWNVNTMKNLLNEQAYHNCGIFSAQYYLNRKYFSMYVEWWVHNIGYYITLPFCFISFIKKLNLRFKEVDLEERI